MLAHGSAPSSAPKIAAPRQTRRRNVLLASGALLLATAAATAASFSGRADRALGGDDAPISARDARWWLRPRERNAFRGLPIVTHAVHAFAERPGAGGTLLAAGGGLTIARRDGDAAWQLASVAVDSASVVQAPAPNAPARPQVPATLATQLAVVDRQLQRVRDSIDLMTKRGARQQVQQQVDTSYGGSDPIAGLLRVRDAYQRQRQRLLRQIAAAQTPAATPIVPNVAPLSSPIATLRQIAFANSRRAWAVGDAGLVHATTDGGRSWHSVANEPGFDATTDSLIALSVMPNGSVLALGRSGATLRRDGTTGRWRSAPLSGSERWLAASHSASRAIAVADRAVYVSNDGMQNWLSVPTTPWSGRLRAAAVRDAQHVLIATDRGELAMSHDAGATWVRGRADSVPIVAADMAGAAVAWVADARGAVWATADLGRSWARVGQVPGGDVTALHVTDPQRAWIATSNAGIYATTDGGATWHAETRVDPMPNGGHVIAATSDRDAWMLDGRPGRVLTTDDAGRTWRAEALPAAVAWRAIAFADSAAGVIVGARGAIAETSDGGRTWRLVQSPGSAPALVDVALARVNGTLLGVAVDSTGTALSRGDGGAWVANGLRIDGTEPRVALGSRPAIYAHGGRVIAVPDSSKGWVLIDAGGSIASVAVDDRGGLHVARHASGGAAIASRDSSGWTRATVVPDVVPTTLAVRGTTLLLGTADGALVTGSGASWSAPDSVLDVPVRTLVAMPNGALWVGGAFMEPRHRAPNGAWTSPAPRRAAAPPWVWLIAPIGAVLLIAGALAPIESTEEGVRDVLVSDRPIGRGDHDALGLRILSDAVSRFLRNVRTTPPLTIAITGQWGTGKSSLMNLVRDNLRDFGFRPVSFNAWHHQKEEHLLAALLQAVRADGVPPLFSRRGMPFRWNLLQGRMQKHRLAVAAVALLGVFWAEYCLRRPHIVDRMGDQLSGAVTTLAAGDSAGAKPSASEDLSTRLLEIAHGAIAAVIPGDDHQPVAVLTLGLLTLGVQLWRGLRTFGANPAALLASVAGSTRTRDLQAQTSFRYRFAQEFRDVTAALQKAEIPMTLLIDDLDRCRPEQVLDVLEAVNFLVSSGECFVILGMDRDRVTKCVGLGFKDVAAEFAAMNDGDSEAEGRRRRAEYASHYLEKLVNIEIPVPTATGAQFLSIVRGADDGTKQDDETPAERRRDAFAWRRIARDRMPPLLAAASLLIAVSGYWRWLGPPQADAPATTAVAASIVSTGEAVPNEKADTARAVAPIPATADAPPQTIGRVVPSTAESPSFMPALLFGLSVTFGALAVVIPRRRTVVHDNAAFEGAVKVWAPVVHEVLRERATPRGAKRFINRVRFYAMRQRTESEDDLAAAVIARLHAEHIAEPELVGLSALHTCWADRMHDEFTFHKLTAELREKRAVDEKSVDWKKLDAMRERFITMTGSVGV